MPPFPPAAAILSKSSFTVTFLCAGGDKATVKIDDIDDSVTSVQTINLRSAIARLSNGGAIADNLTAQRSIAETQAEVYDEAYAEAQTKMVLVFQDEDQNLKTIAIPAPDASYFGSDGVSIIPLDSGTPAAPPTPAQILYASVTDILTVLNLPAASGTYELLKGYRSKRAGKLPRPRTVVTLSEPSAASVPPPDPGV